MRAAACVGEIAEVADTDEASGQHMLAEAAQELACGERHDALLVSVADEGSDVSASETLGIPTSDCTGVARNGKYNLELFAQRAHNVGIRCEIVVRHGMAIKRALKPPKSARTAAASPR
jgi:hypothetical protein